MAKKLQIGIYKINLESDLFISSTDHIDTMVATIKADDSDFELQKIKDDLSDDFEIQLLYKKKASNPAWKEFFSNIATPDQDILKPFQSKIESFAMFLRNDSSGNLYAITGGFGHCPIQDYIDENFGIDILSRIIKKEDKILKAVKEKSVQGGILGSTKFFRNNYNFFENDDFGKIYQELKANLDRKILKKYFGFSLDDIKSDSTCIAKTSFKINKAISLPQLFKIINSCEYIIKNPSKDPSLEPIVINNVRKINKKKNQKLVEELEDTLFKQLWDRYGDIDADIDFDLCSKDFEKYMTASRYVLRKGSSTKNFFGKYEFVELRNIDQIFEELKKHSNKPTSLAELRDLLESLKIYSYNDESSFELTKEWMIYHLMGDISLGDKKYFLIDNQWYEIMEDFINRLNEDCASFVKRNPYNCLDKEWNYTKSGDDENKYNQKYFNEKNTIVLDKILADNIESCDILKWDEKSIYFCHVKAGFGNTMRDLCNQILVSAIMISNDLAGSKEYIGKIYDSLKKKKGSGGYFGKVGDQSDKYTKEEFVKLFKDKTPVFVLAVLDTYKDSRNLEVDMAKFRSSIAKFSLQELRKRMKGIDMTLKITQIKKQS